MRTRPVFWLFLALLMIPAVFAVERSCQRTIEQRVLQSARFCGGNNDAKNLRVLANNIVLDCGSAVLMGDFNGAGIIIENRTNVTLLKCQVAHHETGLLIKNSKDIRIFDSSFIRNLYGIKLYDSTGVVVEKGYDISITKPVYTVNSTGNSFQYINKKINDDHCRFNQCNQITGLSTAQKQKEKRQQPKNALQRTLRNSIRAWLFG